MTANILGRNMSVRVLTVHKEYSHETHSLNRLYKYHFILLGSVDHLASLSPAD